MNLIVRGAIDDAVRQHMGGFVLGLLAGVIGAGLGMAIVTYRGMDKEARGCLQLPTIHEARRCWGEEP